MESPEVMEHLGSRQSSLDTYKLMEPLDMSLLGYDQSKFKLDS